MKGSIYTSQKCPECGGTYRFDENNGRLNCPKHPHHIANRQFTVRFGREHTKRFGDDLKAAIRHLNGLRFKTDEGTYDARDYRADNPLGYSSLANKWLEIKQQQLEYGSWCGIRRFVRQSCEAWGQRSIKTLTYGDLEDFLLGLKVSSKSKYNFRSHLHQFLCWVAEREPWFQSPRVPVVKFTLGMRTIVSKSVQQQIIDEVKRIAPFKVWLGIRWLSIYVKMRPVEMLRLTEKDVNVSGFLIIRPASAKERKPKFVPLLPEDIAFIEEGQKGFSDQSFFRHGKVKGHRAGSPYHQGYLYKWWKKACANLGVDGVDLYGGTRHSTVTALSNQFSREEIKEYGTGHDTSKAFERYFQAETSTSLDVYRQAAQRVDADKHLTNVVPLEKFRKSMK